MLRYKHTSCLVYACIRVCVCVCVLPFNKVGQGLCEIPQSFVAKLHSQKCECIDPEGMSNKSP